MSNCKRSTKACIAPASHNDFACQSHSDKLPISLQARQCKEFPNFICFIIEIT